jgi:MFS transporter, DHA1 family, inner membrane transport protein
MTLAVPASRRGAFMSLSGCARDLAMGAAASIAGWVVTQQPSERLEHFYLLGWLAVFCGVVSIWLASRVRVNESARPVRNSDEGTTLPGELPVVPELSAEN